MVPRAIIYYFFYIRYYHRSFNCAFCFVRFIKFLFHFVSWCSVLNMYFAAQRSSLKKVCFVLFVKLLFLLRAERRVSYRKFANFSTTGVDEWSSRACLHRGCDVDVRLDIRLWIFLEKRKVCMRWKCLMRGFDQRADI